MIEPVELLQETLMLQFLTMNLMVTTSRKAGLCVKGFRAVKHVDKPQHFQYSLYY